MTYFIDLKKLSTRNIERSKEEERIQTKRELSCEEEIGISVKNISRKDIEKIFLEMDLLNLSKNNNIFLTDGVWYYFKNPEDEFLMYNGKLVWNSCEGFLI